MEKLNFNNPSFRNHSNMQMSLPKKHYYIIIIVHSCAA